MPDKVYLDEQGNPIGTGTGTYLDDSGNAAPMNFATVNGERVPVDDGPLDAVSGFVSRVNPLPAVQQIGEALNASGEAMGAFVRADLPAAKEAAGRAVAPVTGLLEAQGALYDKARQAYDAGDYVTAARHFVDYLIPVIGPAMDETADKMAGGQPWRAVGESLGMGLSLFGPKALQERAASKAGQARQTRPIAANPNQVDVQAVQFGQREGIPVDAGTATGNAFIKRGMEMSDATPVGSVVATRANDARARALTATGEKLAARTHPTAIAPEQAGQAAKEGIQRTVTALHDVANKAYDDLRAIERNTVEDVPVTVPDHVMSTMRKAVGKIGDLEVRELRRIAREMEALGYQQGGLVRDGLEGSGTHYVRRSGGASVYHDILQHAPGTSEMTRAEVLQSIQSALETGEFTNAARGALAVARKRLSGKTGGLSKPLLPPNAGDAFESMAMPVDVRTVKKMLRPVYDRMMRQLPVTQQRASPGLKAIENILNGPDYVPATVADADLSAIKGLSRGADLPELRDLSRGLAAKAVGTLERAVRDAVAKGGSKATEALETGRAATRTKWQAGDVLKQMRDEPVQAFQQLVYSKDAGIAQLRKVAEFAPGEMAKVGRAFLDDLLHTATQEGGFGRTDAIARKWQQLGPETRTILFGDAAYIRDLDNFFHLAKRLGEVKNPSGSALGVSAGASVGLILTNPAAGLPLTLGAGAMSKILRSPTAVKFLTEGMRLQAGPGRSSKVAQASAQAAILRAAREAGVAGPAVAGSDAQATGRPRSETVAPAAGR